MTPETVEMWCKMIDRYGVSVVMLFVFVVGTIWAVRWLAKNVARPMIDSHMVLAASVQKTNETNSANLSHLTDSQTNILRAVEKNGKDVCDGLCKQTTELKAALGCKFTEA